MDGTHRQRVEDLLADAAAEHAQLMSQLPPEIAASLPVDAQGVTQANDHLATAAGLSPSERRGLIRPHAVNPAVLHARVFGGAPLARETVIGSFVEGARVRADALTALRLTAGSSDGLGELRVELAIPLSVRTETWRNAVGEYLDHATESVAILMSLVDLGHHQSGCRRIETAERVGVEGVDVTRYGQG